MILEKVQRKFFMIQFMPFNRYSNFGWDMLLCCMCTSHTIWLQAEALLQLPADKRFNSSANNLQCGQIILSQRCKGGIRTSRMPTQAHFSLGSFFGSTESRTLLRNLVLVEKHLAFYSFLLPRSWCVTEHCVALLWRQGLGDCLRKCHSAGLLLLWTVIESEGLSWLWPSCALHKAKEDNYWLNALFLWADSCENGLRIHRFLEKNV